MKTIQVKGPIINNGDKWIYDWFHEDATCPKDVVGELPDDGSDVTLIINSGGGLVTAGNEIYTALKSYAGNVTAIIIHAASAASVIAMAGNPVKMSPVGDIMIHNVSGYAVGDHNAMDKMSGRLLKTDKSISAAYRLKTGKTEKELLAMMDTETWMTAEDAVKAGFADEILFSEQEAPVLVASCEELLPQKVVQRMQELKLQDKLPDTATALEKGIAEPSTEMTAAIEEIINRVLSERGEIAKPGEQPPKSAAPKSLINKLRKEV